MQKDLEEGLVSELKSIREGMKHLPKSVTFPQYPSITAYSDDGEEEWVAVIGEVAEQYLRKFVPSLALIRPLECEIRMLSFAVGTRKQNQGKQYNCFWKGIRWHTWTMGACRRNNSR